MSNSRFFLNWSIASVILIYPDMICQLSHPELETVYPWNTLSRSAKHPDFKKVTSLKLWNSGTIYQPHSMRGHVNWSVLSYNHYNTAFKTVTLILIILQQYFNKSICFNAQNLASSPLIILLILYLTFYCLYICVYLFLCVRIRRTISIK